MHPFARPNTAIDVERYTPPEIAAAARDALGSIDLDPCTTELVNRTFIRASHIYTKETNGLDREKSPWAGKVYVNAPSYIERDGQQQRNSPQLFWERLIVEYEAKRVGAGVYLAFNLEHVQQSQNWNYNMLAYPFCIPSRRLVFWQKKNGLRSIEPRDHPEFANAIIYVGRSIKRFAKAFEGIGTVVIPRIANTRPVSGHGDVSWSGNPMQAGLTAPPIEGCERDPHPAKTQCQTCGSFTGTPHLDIPHIEGWTGGDPLPERFGIHCAVDADPNVNTPSQDPYPKGTDEACRIATAAEEKLRRNSQYGKT